jgi:chemotaxis protein MotB
MSEFDPNLDVDDPLGDHPAYLWGDRRINGHLWVISYSDFMTILMIFFLILFAHRVWEKKMSWEAERISHLRAAQETQRGMVQRLSRLTTLDVAAERINIHLPDALLFDAGDANLRPSATVLLRALAPELNAFTGEIIVEGHTDNRPPGAHARYATNWELSVARAFSVIRCLTETGVPGSKLSARGYGEYRPRASNETPTGQAANRRIEIVLINPKNEALGVRNQALGNQNRL